MSTATTAPRLAVIVAGGSIGEGTRGSAASGGSGIWSVVRWPVGLDLVTLAMTIIFEPCSATRRAD